MLLGDLAMETERFDSAAADYREALSLMQANLEARSSSRCSARSGHRCPCQRRSALPCLHIAF